MRGPRLRASSGSERRDRHLSTPAWSRSAERAPVMNTPIIKRRPLGEWTLAAFILIAAAWFASLFVGNGAFRWDVVGEYLFDTAILQGARTTIILTLFVMGFGCVFGTLVAFMRLSGEPDHPRRELAVPLDLPQRAGAGLAALLVFPRSPRAGAARRASFRAGAPARADQ